MRYRLRTLMIALLVGPPLVAGAWLSVSVWMKQRADQELDQFRLHGSYFIEIYNPRTGRTDWEDMMRAHDLQPVTEQSSAAPSN